MSTSHSVVMTSQGSFPLDEKGAPKQETIQALYDELDHQYAVQAYLWAMPQMVTSGQHNANRYYGAKENLDFLHQYKDPSVLGMLTPNTVTKYVMNFCNLNETGPILLEVPGGQLVGLMMDYQMHWVADIGLTSPAGPNPEMIVFIGPNQNPPEEALANGLRIEQVNTNVSFLAIRVLNPEKDKDLTEKIRLYPVSQLHNPPTNRVFQAKPDDELYFIAPPPGMAYWEQLNEVIQQERVLEVDRYFMSHLAALGIEKGKPFVPDQRQREILEHAAFIGEKMAMVASFVPRSPQAKYRDDCSWSFPITLHPYHMTEHTQQFEERFDFFYEAYGMSPSMKAKWPGLGSAYMGAYRDSDGDWLDGGNYYRFTIAPDPPAAQFWAVTLYDASKRSVIRNGDENRAEISTFTEGLRKNEDGSVDIFFGPEAPRGKKSNWLMTNPGEYWFAYFRLYAPTEAYFDRSWPLYDIKKMR